MPKLVQIKVFGERNTGTRAVIRMIDAAPGLRGAGHPGVKAVDVAPYRALEEHLLDGLEGPWRKIYREAVRDLRDDVLGPIGAWKHAAPRYGAEFAKFDVGVLFMVRNPYSWALSLHRRPYHQLGPSQKDFEAFLNSDWLTLGRDRVDRFLASPVDLWSRKLEAYRVFEGEAAEAGTPTATLRFEDFVSDPVVNLGKALAGVIEEPMTLEELVEPTKKGGLSADERRAYYAQEMWRSGLTRDAVSQINARINWDIAERYGYAQLDPNEF